MAVGRRSDGRWAPVGWPLGAGQVAAGRRSGAGRALVGRRSSAGGVNTRLNVRVPR